MISNSPTLHIKSNTNPVSAVLVTFDGKTELTAPDELKGRNADANLINQAYEIVSNTKSSSGSQSKPSNGSPTRSKSKSSTSGNLIVKGTSNFKKLDASLVDDPQIDAIVKNKRIRISSQ